MKISFGGKEFELTRCQFRWRYCALRFGGAGGWGTAREWLGIRFARIMQYKDLSRPPAA